VSAVYLQQFPSYSNHNCRKSSFLRTPAFIFCLPWGCPCGNHAKRCMNEKTIQCLPNPSQHVPIYLQQFPSYTMPIFSLSTLLKLIFFLIGLKQQLSKIQDCSLTTTHSACNLGFIFDEHLTFSDQITALFKSCYYHIRELRCIRPYLDFKIASTIATSIVHSKLDYCNSIITFQTVNLTGSNRFKTLLLVLLLRLLNPLISLPFSNLSTG